MARPSSVLATSRLSNSAPFRTLPTSASHASREGGSNPAARAGSFCRSVCDTVSGTVSDMGGVSSPARQQQQRLVAAVHDSVKTLDRVLDAAEEARLVGLGQGAVVREGVQELEIVAVTIGLLPRLPHLLHRPE